MAAYYNDNEPYAAAWLRSLIAEGLIADGDVDDRDIRDVRPGDLRGYAQCHFFAGLGGWSLAARLALWPDDREIWTGSCPCQPFSQAGNRRGFADDRHLWPAWFRLIRKCRPSIVFGEQVARAVGQGWLDAVAHDLEGEGYAVGAAVLPACAVAAPHERDRLWFVADAGSAELHQQSGRRGGPNGTGAIHVRGYGAQGSMADANGDTWQQGRPSDTAQGTPRRYVDRSRVVAHVAYADTTRLEIGGEQLAWKECKTIERSSGALFAWPTEPDFPRVAYGIPARVAKLRAIGNAIVPQVAAEFIRAASESD